MRCKLVPPVATAASPIRVEALEGRVLLHALPDGSEVELAVTINFQPAGASVPAGYLVDGGSVFGDRGKGRSYGWDADNRSAARDRNSTLSPDQRYDTLNHTQLYGTRTWEMAVPAGEYQVRVVAGDPRATNSVYGFKVEGVSVVAGRPTSAVRWYEGTKVVAVNDGRLTVSNAVGARNNKIAFVEITSIHPGPTPTTVTITAPDAAAGEADAKGVANPGVFLVTRTGSIESPLLVAYTIGGTATPGIDYPSLFGSVTIPAGATGTTIPVTPAIDALVEGTETVSLALAAGAGYSVGKPAGAVVTITDAAAQPPAPSLARWQTLAPSPVARFESGSAAIDGKLYVFGGYDKNILAMTRSDVYDPVADRWARIADMPQPITHAGIAVDGSEVYFAGGFVGERSFVTTSNVWRYDARDDAWTAITPLPEPRAAGGLVRIGRKLYYFGGANERLTRDFSDQWVLDLDASAGSPAASWQPLAPLPKPRNHFGYAAVNGKIYGIGGQFLKDEKLGNAANVHAYDPATNRWTAVASLPMPLSHVHTATVVVNGRIVTAGGNTNDASFPKTVGNVFSYDPPTNKWVSLPPLPDIRQAAVAELIGERLYVSTGTPRGINPQPTTWSRQVVNAWDAAAAMPVALGETAGGVIGSKLYVVGEGSNATLAYDITQGTWSSATALARRPFPGSHHAAEVVNGKLYLFGGFGGSSEGRVQIYDPAANRWSVGASMPFMAGSASSATIGGKVYVAGGIVGGATTNRAARYDPATNAWAELAPMPRGRNHAAASTDGKRLYVFGGRGAGSGDANTVANGFDTVQVYNPATNKWWSSDIGGSTLRPLPQARGGMGRAVYVNGEFYILGGETLTGTGATPDGVYSRVDIYNPAKNTWRLGPPMPTARHGIYPVLFANRVYTAGGGVRAGASRSAVFEILDLP